MCIEVINEIKVVGSDPVKVLTIKTDVTDKANILMMVPKSLGGEVFKVSIAHLKLAIMNTEHSWTA
jgi:hypothetical protein